MTRWEYMVEVLRSNRPAETLQETLNELGQQGWELVEVSGRHDQQYSSFTCFLKRPLETGSDNRPAR